MNNFIMSNGLPLTEKDLECLAALEKMSDDEIDLSDIPEITDEEFERALARKREKIRRKNLKIA